MVDPLTGPWRTNGMAELAKYAEFERCMAICRCFKRDIYRIHDCILADKGCLQTWLYGGYRPEAGG
jgi:hypothetical protein